MKGHPVATRKPPDSKSRESHRTISATADDWIRQFVKHLELNFVNTGHDLPPDAGKSQLQDAAARAAVATLIDSGLEFQSVLELLGQVAVESQATNLMWNESSN